MLHEWPGRKGVDAFISGFTGRDHLGDVAAIPKVRDQLELGIPAATAKLPNAWSLDGQVNGSEKSLMLLRSAHVDDLRSRLKVPT